MRKIFQRESGAPGSVMPNSGLLRISQGPRVKQLQVKPVRTAEPEVSQEELTGTSFPVGGSNLDR